ncbi:MULTISPECIES: PP2C family protein-serine/threonine phosphatase [Halomonadaceae]|uniref:PP2C family protein-serine/threonine phosphatase n=1 Tax=Halomonadaceae TaxID=28256 RepID=UPI00159721BF|nr:MULTISPECIES: SpoIIE family protein phosphatase [Halomonas]QJQ94925.1 SpoIIE family protein phosphatase [Halomonas sp. PA5]
MASAKILIGLLDRPGDERDALAEAIAKGDFAVVAAASAEQLPDSIALIVAHAHAVPSHEWPGLAQRCPTLVVSDTRLDRDLLKAVEAGLVDYIVEPLRHGDVLRRMIARVIEIHRLAQEHERDRERLAVLNADLEIHLETLRLDQQAGGHIQRKLLPPNPLTVGGVTCDFSLSPSLYLSGDFLDFQRFDERYCVFYFADVSGHGASSAFVTVLLKYLCNSWLGRWDGASPEALPARWLSELNRELLETKIGKHTTLFVGVIDLQRHYLHYSLGAQMPMPMLVSRKGFEVLPGEGMPVGLFPDARYPALGCALPQKFRLWLCSDGVLECLPGNGLDARLKELERLVRVCDGAAALRGRLVSGDEAREEGNATPAHAKTPEDQLPDDLTIMTLSGFDDANV